MLTRKALIRSPISNSQKLFLIFSFYNWPNSGLMPQDPTKLTLIHTNSAKTTKESIKHSNLLTSSKVVAKIFQVQRNTINSIICPKDFIKLKENSWNYEKLSQHAGKIKKFQNHFPGMKFSLIIAIKGCEIWFHNST